MPDSERQILEDGDKKAACVGEESNSEAVSGEIIEEEIGSEKPKMQAVSGDGSAEKSYDKKIEAIIEEGKVEEKVLQPGD